MDGWTYTRDQVKRLDDLANTLQTEAQACAEAGRWRGALVFIGSCIEAGVLALACCCEPELRQRKLWPCQGRKSLHTWELGRLLRLAVSAGWLPSRIDDHADLLDQLDGEIGDAVRFVSRVRNAALHPGNYVVRDLPVDFDDAAHMEPTYKLFSGIAGAVFKNLRDVMLQLSDGPAPRT